MNKANKLKQVNYYHNEKYQISLSILILYFSFRIFKINHFVSNPIKIILNVVICEYNF